MNKFDNQISRMKAMMNYGLQTESKSQYSDIEYKRVGADGKMYGIVREGTKFYIKVSDKTANVLKENFDYIGGFRNRKDHEYTSYANALKNFEMKMHSLNEASNKKDSIIIESWNPDRKEMLTVEATDKMRREIARQRQIMGNATMIQEKKNYTVDLTEAECCKVDKECAATQKNNIAKKSDGKGEPTGQGGDPFTEKVCCEPANTQKTNGKKECKPVMEGEQTLAWNDNVDYLDTTHGTEIGDTAPFTEGEGTEKEMKNGTVEEGAVMHNAQNQNTPAVGVGEVGDDAPFDETVKEEMEGEEVLTEEGDELETEEPMDDMEEEPMEDEMSDDELMDDEMGDEEVDFESDLDDMTDEVEVEEEFDDDMETRLSAIEDLLSKIADKVGVSTFDDDNLYDEEGESDEIEGEDDFLADDEMDMEAPEVDGEEIDADDMEDDDDVEVFESRNYRKAMLKEEEFHYFGQHPAYQKEPMELPEPNHQEKEGYYDMNDDSVENTEAFGNEIGDGAPFEVDPQAIENAIAECVKRILKKKI